MNQLLGLLGLAARAGAVVSGTDAVRNEVREGKVRWVLLADDVAPGQRAKLVPLLQARGVRFHTGFSRDELGRAIGRVAASAVGILDDGFARRAEELTADAQH